ncbi:PREDICTED: zinc finger BED domain-containing protein RICESLEEPER 2-like [Nelumbo nucifera]|uniref:Zinc finger BED domain-containing protein RICESLEEPER 2-like n=2 Tax=Nelumbo nucifera TaxID=4432 RepID=A0A1U7YNN4_NELNU|nr:PREDICTED: zinc finger BED domain-containing protein RICESLEEPER 2-like [Nelumbo nucifera]XP_010241570.1 PREDICTED: zinc finger BED domain-containing protein RICESLEEPER 2-like [Nelumbo nucifera]XP_010241571.1 PREDICTED: zinc finger BED domain-containing protein RICESLEEPER 2-like [Nelumbo nucifera]XP_010241573.1 PREDICTED: zinc finger BED domain-containing protein RICESLEEPER 2-like [Nelumbo nucifera]XP_019056184.1 PREDICTED: zinc finger BED domain-containing protein RICESLEEPER 2-like [Nel
MMVAASENNNELAIANPEPQAQPNNKRRRKKSIVWEHFTIEAVGAGCTRACCKQCKQTFAYSTGSKLAGTSHLKRHIMLGTCPATRRNQEKNQLTPYSPTKAGNLTDPPPRRRYRASPGTLSLFDQDRCRHEIAKMIVMHEYPLHMVEHPGFVAFVQNLQPRFNMVNFSTVQGDCVALYLREKQNLLKVLEAIPGRISLALDLWTSDQTLGYVFVVGHYIDSDWKLHRRILNVVMVPSIETGNAFNYAVGTFLSDWSLENKLFTVTLNQQLLNNSANGDIRGYLSVKNPLMLNGQLLIGHCYAHVLSIIAQDALVALQETISKVRASVKYVKTSDTHEEKFIELKQQLQVPSTKSLSIDDLTKWNTTYLMLVAALELKEVFSCLDTSDPEYKDAPTMDDWKQVETLCIYLKLLYDAANILTSATYPTANIFFHEVWKIHLELTHAAMSQDPFVCNLTRPMQEKFDKYWKDCNLVLALAVVMDPRFKMKLVEFSFSKIYGDDAGEYVKIVDEGIHDLFLEYVSQPLPLTPTYVERETPLTPKTEVSPGGTLLSAGDGLLDFDVYISEISSSQQTKSELDQYLEESLLPRIQEFDILGWWKLNNLKYPTLSRMARDILVITVSPATADSVFNTELKKLDPYRSSLRPETIEALICAKDWLPLGTSSDFSKAVVKMEF